MAQEKTLVDRVKELEAFKEGLGNALGNTLQEFQRNMMDQITARLNPIVSTLNATTAIVGDELVRTKQTEQMNDMLAKNLQAKEDQVKNLVEKSILQVGQAVAPNSVVVGRESDAEGKVHLPGKFISDFNSLPPFVQQRVLGLAVGGSFEYPTGGKLEILEIYEPVPTPAAQQVVEATPTQSTEASAQ